MNIVYPLAEFLYADLVGTPESSWNDELPRLLEASVHALPIYGQVTPGDSFGEMLCRSEGRRAHIVGQVGEALTMVGMQLAGYWGATKPSNARYDLQALTPNGRTARHEVKTSTIGNGVISGNFRMGQLATVAEGGPRHIDMWNLEFVNRCLVTVYGASFDAQAVRRVTKTDGSTDVHLSFGLASTIADKLGMTDKQPTLSQVVRDYQAYGC